MDKAGWSDSPLSSVMLTGLTPMSGTPHTISSIGLFLHVDSLGSFMWWLGSPWRVVDATGLTNVCLRPSQNVTFSVSVVQSQV